MKASQPKSPPAARRVGVPRTRQARGRRWRRRLIKTGAWVVLMVFVTVALAAAVAGLIYHQRTQVANQLLSLPDTPFDIRVERFDGTRGGDFSAESMRVTLPGAAEPLLHVARAEWRLRWRAALAGGVEELVLKEPVLTLDEAHWVALRDWLEARRATPGVESPAAVARTTRRGLNLAPEARFLRVVDGRVALDVPGLPRVRARIDYEGEAIGILAGQPERIRTGLQRIRLREVEIDLPADHGPGLPDQPAPGQLRLAEVSLGFTLEHGHLQLVDVQLEQPAVDLSPQALAWLAAMLPDRQGAEEAGGERRAAVADAPSPVGETAGEADGGGSAPPATDDLARDLPEALTGSPAPIWVSRVSWDLVNVTGARLDLRAGEAAVAALTIGDENLAAGADPDLGAAEQAEAAETVETLILPALGTDWLLTARHGGWSPDDGLHLGDIDVVVDGLQLVPAADAHGGGIDLARGALTVRHEAAGGRFDISRVTLDSPDIGLTPGLTGALEAWRRLLPGAGADRSDERPDEAVVALDVGRVRLVDGRLRVHGHGAGVPEVDLGLHAELAGWSHAGTGGKDSPLGRLLRGWSSADLQRLLVNDATARYPGLEPFWQVDQARLELTPADLLAGRRIERLLLVSPRLRLTTADVPWLGAPDTDAPTDAVADDERRPRVEPGTDRPLWHGWWVRHLDIVEGDMLVGPLPAGVPAIQGSLEVETSTPGADDQPVYYLEFNGLSAMLPEVSEQPVARVEQATLRLAPDDLWFDGSLGELDLMGARLTAGRGLRDHFAADRGGAGAATADGDAAEEPNPWLPDWHFDRLILRESMLTIADIAPGLPDLPIALDLSTDMVPLVMARMREGGDLIKLELSTALRSPQDIRYIVAELPSVFVEFTFAGLLQQEIEQVQVIAPTLNVGEHLFSYVDYYRDMTRGEVPVDGVPDTPLEQAMEPETGWNIKRIEIANGQLVVAPKGVALFPNPFSFSAETELADGRIDATFIVPRDDYEFEQLDLQLEGLSGEILFHMPMAGEDNNLVEVLRADLIRWRDFTAANAFLSVSYDRFGIYVGLGGDAYEGYVNGEFNIYLEHLYNWDGWLSFSGINMRGLTEVISPEYFLMDGTVDLNLVAQGNLEELFEAYGDLTCTTPGLIHISQLDGVLENLPADWSPLKREITKLGIEPLRWFEYREGNGAFDLGRLGGDISLTLSGDQGVRAFDVELHGQPLSMFIEPVLPERLRQAARESAPEIQ